MADGPAARSPVRRGHPRGRLPGAVDGGRDGPDRGGQQGSAPARAPVLGELCAAFVPALRQGSAGLARDVGRTLHTEPERTPARCRAVRTPASPASG